MKSDCIENLVKPFTSTKFSINNFKNLLNHLESHGDHFLPNGINKVHGKCGIIYSNTSNPSSIKSAYDRLKPATKQKEEIDRIFKWLSGITAGYYQFMIDPSLFS